MLEEAMERRIVELNTVNNNLRNQIRKMQAEGETATQSALDDQENRWLERVQQLEAQLTEARDNIASLQARVPEPASLTAAYTDADAPAPEGDPVQAARGRTPHTVVVRTAQVDEDLKKQAADLAKKACDRLHKQVTDAFEHGLQDLDLISKCSACFAGVPTLRELQRQSTEIFYRECALLLIRKAGICKDELDKLSHDRAQQAEAKRDSHGAVGK